MRLALKEAGLDARSVTVEQMVVMLRKVMPGEIRSCGVEQPEAVCDAVVKALQVAHPSTGSATDPESPEAIFRRLAQG